jgi:glycosyltransferase involved in cell wall biosynthesis
MAIPQRDDARRELGLSSEAFVITTVCRLHRPRDFPTLLEAFQRVRRSLPSAELLLVGDGPLRGQLEQLVHLLGVVNWVHVLGMRRDVPRILAATDAYVLSSQGWEGLPLTVLEAMAASLPVVASGVGGTGEAVIHEQTGYLFAPGDVSALSGHLIALARQPALAQSMGQQGLQRVRESFTVERMVRETAGAYDQLVTTRASCSQASDSLRG